jgi:hypothetical protein
MMRKGKKKKREKREEKKSEKRKKKKREKERKKREKEKRRKGERKKEKKGYTGLSLGSHPSKASPQAKQVALSSESINDVK